MIKILGLLPFVCLLMAHPRRMENTNLLPMSTEPITPEMCEMDEYKRLHICVAMKRDNSKLMKTIEEYKYMFEQAPAGIAPAQGTDDIFQGQDPTATDHLNTSRLAERVDALPEMNGRSTADDRNPCAGDYALFNVWEAEDMFSGYTYELVHYPDANIFQTFYIRTCSGFVISGMECARHDIMYKTLVYLYPPHIGDETGVRYVRIKGSCALSMQP